MKLPLSKLIRLLCEKIDKITPYSFLQGHYHVAWHILAHLGSNEATVLGDFPENYSFTIQDEIQGYHSRYHQSQCSIHPIVVYYV